jgi:DNA-binding transcriptional MerR regulator
MPLPVDNNLLTIRKASSLLGVSPDTLRRLEKKGQATPKRGPNGERLYSVDDISLLKNIIRKPTGERAYSIQEASNILRVSPQTIRRWEREGRIKPNRTAGGQRVFTLKDIQTLQNTSKPIQKTAILPTPSPAPEPPQPILTAPTPQPQVEPSLPFPLPLPQPKVITDQPPLNQGFITNKRSKLSKYLPYAVLLLLLLMLGGILSALNTSLNIFPRASLGTLPTEATPSPVSNLEQNVVKLVAKFTKGSVIFQGIDSENFSENNKNFFWDDAKAFLGIGTNIPNSRVTISGKVDGAYLLSINSEDQDGIFQATNDGVDVTNIDYNGNLSIAGALSDLKDSTLNVLENLATGGDISVGGGDITSSKALKVYSTTSTTLGGTTSNTTINGNDITISSSKDVYFDDDSLTSSIKLTNTATSLPNGNTGIVDAISDAWNKANSISTPTDEWGSASSVVYPNSTSDNLAIGGTTSSAPFYVAATTGNTKVGDLTVAGALNLSGNSLTSSGDLIIDPTGGGVKIGTGVPGTIDLAGDDLYVTGDLEVGGTIYGTVTASSVPFSGITSASNTTAAMVVDTGASLTYSNSGTINASSLIGNTWISPGAIGSTTPNTGAFTSLSASSTVNFAGLTASKAVFTDGSKNLTSTGTVGADQGGTGFSSYTVGDLLYADTTTTLARLNDVATGNVLISGGVSTAPSWGKVTLGTHTTGNYVSQIFGTANQITASAATGDVTLSIPSDFRTPGTASVSGNLTIGNGNALQSAYGPLTLNHKSGDNAWTPSIVIHDVSGDIDLAGGYAGGSGCTIDNSTGTLSCTSISGTVVGSVSFANITSGTNTGAAMVVDTGASLTYANSGTINASSLQGATWASPLAIGNVTPAAGTFTTLTGDNLLVNQYATVSASLALGSSTASPGPGNLDMSGNLMVGGNINANGYVSIANQLNFTGSWGQVQTTDANADLTIQTAAGTGKIIFSPNATEAMRITDLGKVGIGTTSPTAKLDVAGTASISGTLTFRLGTGTIQTTGFNPLVLGGDTTGNITISASNDIAGGFVAPNVTNVTDLGLASKLWRNIYGTTIYQGVNQVCDASNNCGFAAGTNYWGQISGGTTGGVLYSLNNTVDLLIGSNATSSAKFAFINVNSGTPTASISGSTAGVALSMDGNGNISTTNMAPLTIGNATTGSVQLSPKGTTGLKVDGDGNTWIGGTTNTATASSTPVHITIIDQWEYGFVPVDVALGPDGFARISVQDGSSDLHFVRCTNADCSTRIITNVDSTGLVGADSSIAIGSDGFARISYYDQTNTALKFVQCTNTDCSTKNITTVDNTAAVGNNTSIALGSDGFARISYYDDTTDDLKYAQCTNADCSTSTITVVDSADAVGLDTSIALGSDGFARISYYDTTNTALKFVQCTNDACSTSNITTIDNTASVGLYSSIAIASDGFARISYFDATNTSVKFARCTNAACTTSNVNTIDNEADFGNTSIAIGLNGLPQITKYYVSYDTGYNNALGLIQCTNADCTTNTFTKIDSNAQESGEYNSIVIGSDGYANIAYTDYNGALRFARVKTTSFTPNGDDLFVDGSIGVGGDIVAQGDLLINQSVKINDSLVIGSDTKANTLRSYSPWMISTIDANPGWPTGENSAITVGSDYFARITYGAYDPASGSGVLKYILCESLDCSSKTTTIIDSPNYYDYVSIVLGSDGFARISYYDTTSDDLKFIRCTNEDCSTGNYTVIDSTGNVGAFNSIVLGADGFARISYADTTNGDSKFVQCTNADCTTNVITVIDNSGANFATSVKMATDGFARIAYLDNVSGVNFVQCTNDSCSTNSITSLVTYAGANTSDNVSLGFGSTNRPIVSYSGPGSSSTGGAKIIYCSDTTCTTSTQNRLDPIETRGLSMAVYSNRVGVAYHDYDFGSVKFAWIDNSGCTQAKPCLTTIDNSGFSGTAITSQAVYNGYYYVLYDVEPDDVWYESTVRMAVMNYVGSANMPTRGFNISQSSLSLTGDLGIVGDAYIDGNAVISSTLELQSGRLLANSFNFTADGLTNLASIDNSGNLFVSSKIGVGIDPAQSSAQLDIAGSASMSGTLSFRGTTDPKIDILNNENFGIRTSYSGGAALTERFTILNNGKIGIGTTTPISKLSVQTTSANSLGKAAFLVDQYESQDILTASASGVTKLILTSAGNLLPGADDTQDIGASPSARWANLFLGPNSLHIQAKTTDSGYSGLGLNLDYAFGINTSGSLTTSANGTTLTSLNPYTGDFAALGVGQFGGITPTIYSRFGTASTGHSLANTQDVLIGGDFELNGVLYLDSNTIAASNGTSTISFPSDPTALGATNLLTNGTWLVQNPTSGNPGLAALMVNQQKGGDIFTASASGISKFTIDNLGNATASGNITMGGQLQVGRFDTQPTPLGAGVEIFNTVTNTFQCYNGNAWFNCGGTLYSNTNASVADGSYITVTHNLNTTDLLADSWINAQSAWKLLDATYQPAIAWEGKDTEKGVYHDTVNSYTPTQETSIVTASLAEGLLYDTFEDLTKGDSANTTSSVTTQMLDNGATNYVTLQSRIQGGRAGLIGGQTYNTATNDNDGQAYLGSDTVNDTFYYDRAKDSTPEVLVELGIDPNWYNGVTLSVATTSAQFSQNSTVPYDKNPNLTTSYNGSLIRVTGTDAEPTTIYITIKSPTTFDWTNYNGDAATGVTITPGIAQTLGVTGVSVTFSNVNYNTGDTFRIASWFIEPEGTTRGARQQFPERSYVVATAGGTDIIDADTQKLWMRASSNVGWKDGAADNSVTMLNGTLYIASTNLLRRLDFVSDKDRYIQPDGLHEAVGVRTDIAARNSTGSSAPLVSNTPRIVAYTTNDVSAAVIPNAPTQEVTVSGWGYIAGAATQSVSESVLLPYKFNNAPHVTVTYAGSANPTTTPPRSPADCQGGFAATGQHAFVTNNNFTVLLVRDTGGVFVAGRYECYTWTATGTVSPKQFVAVATDGGSTVINETDSYSLNSSSTTAKNRVALTNSGVIYVTKTAGNPELLVTYGVHGLPDSYDLSRQYYISSIPAAVTSTTTPTSLYVTEGTSTIDGVSNTIYLGSLLGVSVIQEKQMHGNGRDGEDAGYEGSVKYYTKDYISEEMVGNIRGMWPLNNANASSDFEDVSVKAETLTGTNITASGDSVSGVRGTATDFNGTDEYMSCTDASCGGTGELDIGTGQWSVGAWIKTSQAGAVFNTIISKGGAAGQNSYQLYTYSGKARFDLVNTLDAGYSFVVGTSTVSDGNWHYVVATWNPTGTITSIYVDGKLESSTTVTSGTLVTDSTSSFVIGNISGQSAYFSGVIDEPFVTAHALSASQIKHMYEVGYRALQSHGTGLGGGAADTNQQLGYISTGTNVVGDAVPDYNNQFMYVGTNSTTLGAVSKIQLDSDTNIKTYNSSANVPAGGPLLIDEDTKALAVGETLEAVGSAASGVKSMGLDNNATATSGNFVSKTFTLPKNIASTVLWVSPVLDSSDGSNTLTVKASNDGGSNYVTCSLVGTDSSKVVPEREYACTFATSNNSLKVKFEFARGSTKTNTYVTQYGITWLGQTGFRIEQADANSVRLYNYSGETQNLKLNVTGASTTTLANPWTDSGSYLYPTGYEQLRVYDGAGTNYMSLSHSGSTAQIGYNGTVGIALNSSGRIVAPSASAAEALFVDPTYTDPVANTSGLYSVSSKYLTTANNTFSNYGVVGISTVTQGGYTNSGSTIGVLGFGIAYGSSGTASDVMGTSSLVFNLGTGTITNAYGSYINTNSPISGPITNSYGLYINPQTGGSTLNYQLYSAGTAPSYFAGNVGIGTTSPQRQLTISGTAPILGLKDTTDDLGWAVYSANSGNQFRIAEYTSTDWTASTDRLVISQGGNVGIGTTSPPVKTQISLDGSEPAAALYNAASTALMLTNTTTNGVASRLVWANDTAGINGILAFTRSRNTLASPTTVASGDALGGIQFQGYEGTARVAAVTIASLVDGTVSTGIIPGRLTISTVDTGGVSREAVRIDSSQNVGIGTTSPGYRLEVVNNVATGSAMIRNSSATAAQNVLNLKVGAAFSSGTQTRFINLLNANGVIAGKAYLSSAGGATWNSGNGDLAEYFTKDDPNANFAAGTVMCQGSNGALPCSPSISSKILGIVSASPAFLGGTEGPDKIILALQGQVPVLMSPTSPNIASGDLLTIGDNGLATKALGAGFIVGRALQSWSGASGENSVQVNVVNTWGDPNMAIADLSGLSIDKNPDTGDYKLIKQNQDGTSQLISTVGAFAKLIVGKIKAGAIETTDFVSENLIARVIKTDIISPLPGNTDVTVQIGSATESGKFAIQDSAGSEVASIDNEGNAAFDGTISSEQLAVNGEATVAGTLFADEIRSKSLDDINALLAQVEADQALMMEASTWDTNTATGSALFNSTEGSGIPEQLIIANLYVTSEAAINSLSVTSNLAIGTDFVITSQDSSLNTLTKPLKIQSLALAPVEIMAGLVTIDTSGNVMISGNLAVKGEITTQKLTIKPDIDGEAIVASIDASGSAMFSDIRTGKITGSDEERGSIDILPAEDAKLVERVWESTPAAVLVSPSYNTQAWVENSSLNGFTIRVSNAPESEVQKLYWWAIW